MTELYAVLPGILLCHQLLKTPAKRAAVLNLVLRVRTAEGKDAQSITSSEAAAMLDLMIVPTLRQLIIDKYDFEDECKKFAAEVSADLGLAPHEWAPVHFLRFLSIDNAPIYMHWRKLCLQPRISDEALVSAVRKRYAADFEGKQLPSDYDIFRSCKAAPQPQGPNTTYTSPIAADLCHRVEKDDGFARHDSQPYAPPPLTAQQEAGAALRYGMENNFANWRNAHERSEWEHEVLHRLSRDMSGVLFLLPQQFMPLPKMTPDNDIVTNMQCPFKHMVGTVKRQVRKKLLDVIHGDEDEVDVFLGQLYQRFINEAVAEYGNNEKGRTHVRRSWDKQKCICEIRSARSRVCITSLRMAGRMRPG